MHKILAKIGNLIVNIKDSVASLFRRRRRKARRRSTGRRTASASAPAGTRKRKSSFAVSLKRALSSMGAFFGRLFDAAKMGIYKIAAKIAKWLSKFDRRVVYGCTAGLTALVVAAVVLLAIFASPNAEVKADSAGNVLSPEKATVLSAGDEGTQTDNDAQAEGETDGEAGTVAATAKPTETPEPTPEPTEDPMTKTYKNGMEDPFVAEIQQRLMELNYMDDDIPTEKYGSSTTQAITYFQRKNGIKMTGKAGKKTLKLLFSDEAKVYTVSNGDDGNDVHEIQDRLVELGYIDKITGHFGDETEAAVKTFQEKNGLTADGSVGEDTLEMLYSEDAKANFMSYGEKSTLIEKYQKKLKQLGYLTTEADGTYGEDTVNAVKRFQTMNDLIADGFLGPSTRELLDNGTGKANALVLGVSGSDVMRIQERLVELKYMRRATGYFGSDTEASIKKFQSLNGLTADGKVGTYTMNVLFSDYAKKNTGSIPSGTSGGSSGGSSGGNSGGNSGGSSGGSSGGNSGGNSGGTVKYNKSVSSLLSVAKSKLGCRYVSGGKGPSTFDCSGFVYYCLKSIGVNQSYWTSSSWRGNGKYQKITSMSSIKAGDIISLGNGLNHVGIALGGGMMIDASSGDGCIRITNLSLSYWQSHFYAAYRVLG